jgi:hypothetical protein
MSVMQVSVATWEGLAPNVLGTGADTHVIFDTAQDIKSLPAAATEAKDASLVINLDQAAFFQAHLTQAIA